VGSQLDFRAAIGRGVLRSLGGEAIALARQATLLRRDVRSIVPDVAKGDVVVFVHGFLATAGVLRPLRDAVERQTGATTASFTHPPGLGIERIAERLLELVENLASEELRLYLVGHSIGGLAVHWFATELGSDSRLVGTISIASPFFGAPRARHFPGTLARDIEPGSAFLERLRAAPSPVPHLSIAGGADRTVPSGATLPAGDRLVVEGAGHNAVLYHPDTVRAVVSRVAGEGRGARSVRARRNSRL
jgi:pimeloyl-ACP methyl ester carboxylesterase